MSAQLEDDVRAGLRISLNHKFESELWLALFFSAAQCHRGEKFGGFFARRTCEIAQGLTRLIQSRYGPVVELLRTSSEPVILRALKTAKEH